MVQIETRYVDQMVAHAIADLPNECCGILAGRDGQVMKLYPMTNVEASPFRFSMDPQEVVQVDREAGTNGWDLQAIYHSHTRSEAYPSDTDVRLAAGISELWPDVKYVLISLMDVKNPQVRQFNISGGKVTEESLDLTQ